MNAIECRKDGWQVSRMHILFLLLLFLPFSVSAAETGALRSINEKVFVEVEGGRMWQLARSKKLKSQAAVQDYLRILNRGEYSDWRLPTREEVYNLFSIFDLKNNGNIRMKIEGRYWMDDNGVSVGSWEIGEQCGPERTFYSGKTGYVRAVRP